MIHGAHSGKESACHEGGMFWEDSIETCILSRVKQITSPGWMHETSAQAWCTGKTRGIGWRGRWEGGSGWGIHVNPWLIHVNVWQKQLQYCKVISLQLIKINEKKSEKNLPANVRDLGDMSLIPGLGRSPGGGNGKWLQYSCLENSHGQRSLVGYSPWGCRESDTTEPACTGRLSWFLVSICRDAFSLNPTLIRPLSLSTRLNAILHNRDLHLLFNL